MSCIREALIIPRLLKISSSVFLFFYMVQWACQTQGQGLSPLQGCLHFRYQLQVWESSYLGPTGYIVRSSREYSQVWQFTGKTQTTHRKCCTYDYCLIRAKRLESEMHGRSLDGVQMKASSPLLPAESWLV